MTLEYLIDTLKTIQVMHPNADALVVLESPEAGSTNFDIINIRYDNLSKTAVIEL